MNRDFFINSVSQTHRLRRLYYIPPTEKEWRAMDFHLFANKEVVHDGDMAKETYCETQFTPPHLYPLYPLSLRTWRFHSLPEDISIYNEGCKVKTLVEVDKVVGEPDTHIHYTTFHLTGDGYLTVSSGGVEATVVWEKKSDYFILTDFEGRRIKVFPFHIEEIISPSELKVQLEKIREARNFIKSLKKT